MTFLRNINWSLLGLFILLGSYLPAQSIPLEPDGELPPKSRFEIFVGTDYAFSNTLHGSKEQNVFIYGEPLTDSTIVRKEYQVNMTYTHIVNHPLPVVRAGFHYDFPVWRRLRFQSGAEVSRDYMKLSNKFELSPYGTPISIDTIKYFKPTIHYGENCDSFDFQFPVAQYDDKLRYTVYYLTVPLNLTYSFLSDKWELVTGINFSAPVYITKRMKVLYIDREDDGNKTICHYNVREASVPDSGDLKRLIVSGSLVLNYHFSTRLSLGISTRYNWSKTFSTSTISGKQLNTNPLSSLGIIMAYMLN